MFCRYAHSLHLTTQISFANVFARVPLAPLDPIIGINAAFTADTHPRKVNLQVRIVMIMPYVFKVVRKVEHEIVNDHSLLKEYTPADGLPGFNKQAQKLIFGEHSPAVKDGRIATVQTLSGTGSLRLGFQFIRQAIPSKVLMSNPTWANHDNAVKRAGLTFEQYPYYNPQTKKIQFDSYLNTLNGASEGTIVLMHACAHNPTGVDPTQEQWKKIAEVMKKNKLIPFFDSAYQGFASGDLHQDAKAIRYFLNEGFNMFVSQSFAKNMGLYGERVGALHVVTPDAEHVTRILSQIKLLTVDNYLVPPLHGARIAEKVLSCTENFHSWQTQLRSVANRIISMRTALRTRLEDIRTPGSWKHITDQIGMFSYTGLNERQVIEGLTKKHHIYLVKNGRISMAGINSNNVNYVADAIKDAVVNIQ